MNAMRLPGSSRTPQLISAGWLLAGAVLAGSCAAQPEASEAPATIEQEVLVCGLCLPAEQMPDGFYCEYDNCTASSGGPSGCSTCSKLGETRCYFQTNGFRCTTPLGKTSECHDGICGGHDAFCLGCFEDKTADSCVDGDSPNACGSGGVLCEDCDDGNDCTLDSCEVVTRDGTHCEHTERAVGDTCDGGICARNPVGNLVCCQGCVDGETCRLGNTAAACGVEGETCQVCDNADACDGREICDASGQCQDGEVPDCNDNNECTEDSCDPIESCQHDPLSTGTCSDANPCTLDDTCNQGDCQGTPLVCNDGESCTSDRCDEATGSCVFDPLANEEPCDDGNDCTTDDQCLGGTCQGDGVQCSDGVFCTADLCSDDECSYDAAAMNGEGCQDPNDLCQVGQLCLDGECTGGQAKDCDDANECTEDSCVALTGECLHAPVSGSVTCSDGNSCTEGDQCDTTGQCVGVEVTCTRLDECHGVGTCEPSSGLCDDPREPDHTPCHGGECIGGVCQVTATGGSGGGGGAESAGSAGTIGLGGNAAVAGGSGVAQSGAPTVVGGGSAQAGQGEAGEAQAPQGGGSGVAGQVDQGGESGAETAEGGTTSQGGAGEDQPAGNAGEGGTAGSAEGDPADAGQPSEAGEAGETTAPAGEPYQRDPRGCGCRTAPHRSGLPLGMLLLVALGFMPRRRNVRP